MKQVMHSGSRGDRMSIPAVDLHRDQPLVFSHLETLTGEFGLFEHAEYARPRVNHGYTTDDNARALVVLGGIPPEERPSTYQLALEYVIAGRVPFGWQNRMTSNGEWRDRRGSDDCHGRALWGLGAAIGAGESDDDGIAAFVAGLDLRSVHLRSMSFAVLGASAARNSLDVAPHADRFLDRVIDRLPRPMSGGWKWPEPRLTYANARFPQALIAAGAAAGRSDIMEDGLELLAWLMEIETRDGWYSFTPVGGRGPDDVAPGFDQQPIEAWAMADACLTAFRVDGSSRWREGVGRAVGWFLGDNDNGAVLYDESTGAGFDGLEPTGKNLNRGAESTLSALGTMSAWNTVRQTVSLT